MVAVTVGVEACVWHDDAAMCVLILEGGNVTCPRRRCVPTSDTRADVILIGFVSDGRTMSDDGSVCDTKIIL